MVCRRFLATDDHGLTRFLYPWGTGWKECNSESVRVCPWLFSPCLSVAFRFNLSHFSKLYKECGHAFYDPQLPIKVVCCASMNNACFRKDKNGRKKVGKTLADFSFFIYICNGNTNVILLTAFKKTLFINN